MLTLDDRDHSQGKKMVPNGEQNVDRLSALPDGVICHILSFISTKLSASTSILAKRWRFLWAHVPVLDFKCEYISSNSSRFPGIINTVMLRHKVESLNTFRLSYLGDDDDDDCPCYEHETFDYDDGPFYELETCIATVIERRNVQNLYLDLRVEVPRCLLTCKTLVNLTLKSEDINIPPSSGPISLPNLKKLYLSHLHWEVDTARLLSGCPVLEELIIIALSCRDPRGCCISSPTLKRLTIIRLLDRNKPGYMVTINTPALRYLQVTSDSCNHISIPLSTYYLVEVEIVWVNSPSEPNDFYHRCVLKYLVSICKVKCLTLTGLFRESWDEPMPGSIVKFGNLTKLEFSAPWSILTKFLESADHLQVLTIFEEHWHSKRWMDPVEAACLLHSLRIVRIDGFRCTEQGFNMVRYILRNAQVLERMVLYCPRVGVDSKEKSEAIQKITLFRRESKKCELVFF